MMSEIREDIKSEINKIRIVDAHDHTMTEADRNEYAVDFSYLFLLSNCCDLVSAGMPPRLMEAFRLPVRRCWVEFNNRMRTGFYIPPPERDDMSLAERWQAFEPYWEAMRNTSYAKQTLRAVRDIFGTEDLNRDTYVQLSQAIADSRRPGWYHHVMKEKARIDVVLLDLQNTNVDKELFAPLMELDAFIQVKSRVELMELEEDKDE